MSTTTLIGIIVALCQFNDPKISRDYKELCLEHYVNCSIIGPGDIDFSKCKQYKGKTNE